ncbi:MAG: tRNA epoxyqueuosine(34) reductase QueG [Bacteroidetes bacterium]|nr:tRNA epoxyqueuosine(34) reductase QueG [Bacteroidota bacterium]
MNKHQLTTLIKRESERLGFDACGVSKAEKLDDEARLLEGWLNQNLHGKMDYMANHFDKRIDPSLLVENAKSVISFSHNYYTENVQLNHSPKIAMYALGKDYHEVVKHKLNAVLNFIREQAGEVNGRCFVDSAPVLERAWAKRSGIGWQGKNTNLLTKRSGSYFFLAEIILDLELEYDSPVKDYCGTCTKCIDACPTDAIYEPYKVDGSKCISYFTIELKDEKIPAEMKGKFENWMFGCDICQQVCPINTQAKTHNEPQFSATTEILNMQQKDWDELNEENFKTLFKGSPVTRTKFKGLKRNIDFLK